MRGPDTPQHRPGCWPAGVPVEVVPERARARERRPPLAVHQHVHTGMGREAADRFAALLDG